MDLYDRFFFVTYKRFILGNPIRQFHFFDIGGTIGGIVPIKVRGRRMVCHYYHVTHNKTCFPFKQLVLVLRTSVKYLAE